MNKKNDNAKELSEVSDINVEQIKWYYEHWGEIQKIKEYEKYVEELKETAKTIIEKTWAGKLLNDNRYEILDLGKANRDFREFLKLDSIDKIFGVYEQEAGGQQVKKTVPITKDNFYNAFYEPIWQNLNDSEKIKSLEWMFEKINDKYKFGIKELSYFAKFDDIEEYSSTLGEYNLEDNTLYLNLNYLHESSAPLLLIEVLGHELTHARQQQLAKNFDKSKKHTFTEISHTDLGNFNYLDLGVEMHIDEATSYALYRVSQSEKLAEFNGLKYVKNYIDLNEKDFGKNENITNKFNKLKHQILFNGTTKYKDSLNREHFTGTSGILTNEKVILKGNSEILLKLIMLKNFYEYKILEFYNQKEATNKQVSKLYKDLMEDRISQDEWINKNEKLDKKIEEYKNEIRESRESISYIKSVFVETVDKGKLPEYFDKHEFDVLNILDEPKSEYCLPEWLREDEIAYNKEMEKEMKIK